MILFDFQAEMKAIHSILDSPVKIREKLYSKLDVTYFGSVASIEIFKRIKKLKELGKNVGNSKVFKHDVSLSSEAKEAFKKYVKPVKKSIDANVLRSTLNTYKKYRIAHDVVGGGLKILGNKNIDLNRLVTSFESMLKVLKETEDLEKLSSYIGKKPKHDSTHADNIFKELLSSTKPELITTGFKAFDEKSGGLPQQSLTVLMSETSGGKSVMGMHIALHAYLKLRKNVCIITLEMSEEDYWKRILSTRANFDITRLTMKKFSPKQKKRLFAEKQFLKKMGEKNDCTLNVSSLGDVTMSEIVDSLKPYNYDLVIVDLLNLLKSPDPKLTEAQSLGQSARLAKLGSKTLKCPMILMSQMDEKEFRVKYSKAIKENADFVWAWRWGDQEKEDGIIEVVQQKHRNAPGGEFCLKTDYSTMTMRDATEDDLSNYNRENSTENKKKSSYSKNVRKKTDKNDDSYRVIMEEIKVLDDSDDDI